MQESEEDAALWQQLESLGPEDVLPENLPSSFYLRLYSHLQAGRYAERLAPFLERWTHDKCAVGVTHHEL